MTETKRLEYKEAIATKDWEAAADMVRADPKTFGTPPDTDVPEIVALASDPTKVTYMLVEWRITKNDCANCKPITLNARQFDHLEGEKTQKEIQAWVDGYIKNRKDFYVPDKRIGDTIFLVKVEQIIPITDFKGKII
jgi:hypothetical protein